MVLVEVGILLAKPHFTPKRRGRMLFRLASTNSRRSLPTMGSSEAIGSQGSLWVAQLCNPNWSNTAL